MKKKHPTPEIKKKVVAAKNAGNSTDRIAKIFGFSARAVQKWVSEANNGSDFIKKKSPGSGRPAILDQSAGKKLLSIIEKPASSFGFETDLWNTSRLKIVCNKKLKIKISKMAIWRYLTRHYFEQTQKNIGAVFLMNNQINRG